MKIGFFDSGLGGLMILKSVSDQLPQYDYEYYGDTANVPYGDKSEEEIYELTKAGVGELFERNCALVIIACNTASAETLRRLQDTFLVEKYPDRRILGVIIPTVEEVAASGLSRILLIGTRRTVNSGKYERELSKFEHSPTLEAIATPGLVPLIEAGKKDEAFAEVLPVIENFVQGRGDGLILGCTHYTTMREKIQERFPELKIFSQDTIIPTKLASYLEVHPEIESRLTQGGTRNIFLTAHTAQYDDVIKMFLGGVFMSQ